MHKVKKVFTNTKDVFNNDGWVGTVENEFEVKILYDNDDVIVIIEGCDEKKILLTGGDAIKFLIETNLKDKAE